MTLRGVLGAMKLLAVPPRIAQSVFHIHAVAHEGGQGRTKREIGQVKETHGVQLVIFKPLHEKRLVVLVHVKPPLLC